MRVSIYDRNATGRWTRITSGLPERRGPFPTLHDLRSRAAIVAAQSGIAWSPEFSYRVFVDAKGHVTRLDP